MMETVLDTMCSLARMPPDASFQVAILTSARTQLTPALCFPFP